MAWTEWVDSVDTNEVPRNLRLLMAVRHLTDQLWIDEGSLAPFLQTSRQEARDSFARLAELTMGGLPIMGPVAGTPSGSTPAFRLTSTAISSLEEAYLRQAGSGPYRPGEESPEATRSIEAGSAPPNSPQSSMPPRPTWARISRNWNPTVCSSPRLPPVLDEGSTTSGQKRPDKPMPASPFTC